MPLVLQTPVCDLLGIDVPIMQAGMGGVAYGRLAAAVSDAGGLGSIGGIDITPDELDAEIRLFRTLSSRPLCVDLGFPANAPKGLADHGVGVARGLLGWRVGGSGSSSLVAGAPAANLIASHMVPDEHSHHRIPVIVDLLKAHPPVLELILDQHYRL